MELPKVYNPSDFEEEIYKKWESGGLFNPDNLHRQGKEPFSVVLPPPNVTGTLHLGHAAMLAIEDLFVRYKRMKGYDAVWIPGTDHAAIATQNVVEKKILKEQGKTRHDLGRELFLKEVDKFVLQSKDTIHRQIKKMGSSMDWDREAYTLDETRSRAVRKVFKMMHDDGLIYRGYRIVNWCPRCQSTLADDEIDYKEAPAKLYTFKYNAEFPFSISTTRPETKLGDTAVAVNPKDKRYKKFIGKIFNVNFCGIDLGLKIIGDEQVDMDFGTGALGVTPAHSAVDYEMAQKNNLEIIKVIDEHALMTDKAGMFKGMNVDVARDLIVQELEKSGLMEKVEDMRHNLSLCYRCGTLIEPLTSEQWFVDVDKKVGRLKMSLKEKAIEVVKKGEIKIIPERFEKVYFHWMENLHDWCVSRQIWFGHRIPVWYKKETEMIALRHGEALNNTLNKLNSDINNQANGLTAKGKKQIKELAKKFKGEKIDIIFASDFRRTMETANIIAEKLNLKVIPDHRLREIGVGEFEGRADEEFTALRQGNFEKWHYDSPRGIESFDSLKKRVFSFMDEIKQNCSGKKILVVAHGDVLRVIPGYGANLSDEEIFNIGYPDVGHFLRIKVKSEESMKVSEEEINDDSWEQDGDTLDTWFSAGLWTFTTLLENDFKSFDKKDNPDLARFHPVSIMETGYDILFFWVARMILMTTYAMEEIPFQAVYLHGLIRDERGEKMSKSKPETAIDPIEVGEKYGFDAVRLSLLIGNMAGNDMRLYDEKIAGFRNFVNKLWNISRYILMGVGDEKLQSAAGEIKPETLADRWILSRLNVVIAKTTKLIDEYNFSQAGELLREFTWNEFADWYLEIAKIEKNKDEILIYVLKNILKLWHPFVPFVTSAIWSQFNKDELMASKWPSRDKKLINAQAETEFGEIQKLVADIRNWRAENKVEPHEAIDIEIEYGERLRALNDNIALVQGLARIKEIKLMRHEAKNEGEDLFGYQFKVNREVDPEKEKQRLAKERDNLGKYIAGLEKKLGNEEFVKNAPAEIVEGERRKLDEARERLAKI